MTTMPNASYVEGANRLSVIILNRNFHRLGPGPIGTCLGFLGDTVLSNAGQFSARFPANDPRLKLLELKHHYLEFRYDGELLFLGIAEEKNIEINNDGQQIVVISGRDMLARLDETSLVFASSIAPGWGIQNLPFHIIERFNFQNDYALNNEKRWTVARETPPAYPITDTGVIGEFYGESALTGLVRVAERTGEAFRFALNRALPIASFDGGPVCHIEWIGTTQIRSNIRAIQTAGDVVAAEGNRFICFIQRFVERRNASALLTRIHPYGSGFGETKLDLLGMTRVLPDGFAYDPTDNSITNVAAESALLSRLSKHVHFKEIRPLFNTDADMIEAKNYLADAALAYLQRNDDDDDAVEYDLDVVGLPNTLKVGQTIHVAYVDDHYEIDDAFFVLGIRAIVDSNGSLTHSLTIAPKNQWRLRDSSAIVARMEEGELLTAHPQIDANAYWENFREEVGDDSTNHLAEFPFFLSAEVVTIRQVLFRYRVDPILVGTNSYAYAANDTEQNEASNTGASSAADTGDSSAAATAGVNTAATAGSNTTATADVNTASTGGSSVGTTDGASVTIDNATVTIGSDSSATGTPDTLFTGSNHGDIATATQGPTNWTPDPSIHHHDIGTHVHEYSHTHATNHSHTNSPHSHSNSAHSHGMAHTHTMAHTHNMPHTHDMPHTHNMPHTHTMAHTHSSPQHVHTLPALIETFAVKRVPALDSYVLADLEYSVNGGAWAGLDTGIPVAGGYYELDVTGEIQEGSGLRRPLQEYNVVEVRRKASAGTGKSAMVRAKIGVRSTIQSIVIYE